MQITYPPEMLPTSDGDEATVIACSGTECCLREENERLRAEGLRFADMVHQAYGQLPVDRPPGPPTNLVREMRSAFEQSGPTEIAIPGAGS